MSRQHRSRVQAGVSQGGQFAHKARNEADVHLTGQQSSAARRQGGLPAPLGPGSGSSPPAPGQAHVGVPNVEPPAFRRWLRKFIPGRTAQVDVDGPWQARGGRTYGIAREGNAVVARDENGEVVGFINWMSNNEIGNVSVFPAHQRQGLATEMLARAQSANPKLRHSDAGHLSPEGKAWVREIGDTPGRRVGVSTAD